MCGFLGEYSLSNSISSKENFEELLRLSKHRGPDATNVLTEEYYQLGFNRLALLDLSSAGDQPKASPSTRYQMVFNGEVYNFKKLINKYKLKNLRSSSDTEVILQLLDILPVPEVFKQLNGMFAIAVIDNHTKELHLTRDFAGIKPLYFGIHKNGVVFASQFNQVFKHPWFYNQLQLRKSIVKEYFAFGYMQAPNTIYENIFQVNPGQYLKIFKNGKIEEIQLISFSKEHRLKDEISIPKIKSKLKQAVKLQLKSDRPLASFLSGGIDSPLITGIAKKQNAQIKAFTLEVDDEKINEARFAQSYAKSLNVVQENVKVQEKDLLEIVEEHFSSFSEPFGDYSSIPAYLVTKKAKQTHTAMLSGDGGDELFYGYPRMYDFLKRQVWFCMPLCARKFLVRITNRIGLTNTYAPYLSNLESFWMNKHIKLPICVLNSSFSQVQFSQEMNTLYRLMPNSTYQQKQHFLKWNEFYTHMQRVLVKVDRTSMKNSLEVRVPFLDKNVIASTWHNQVNIKELKNLKRPLKEILKEFIPEELLMKEKKGFTVPLEKWFRNELKQSLVEVVLDKDLYGAQIFQQQALKTFVEEFIERKHQNVWGVWHIYSWQKWAIQEGLIP